MLEENLKIQHISDRHDPGRFRSGRDVRLLTRANDDDRCQQEPLQSSASCVHDLRPNQEILGDKVNA
jgi:hypothetical protein